MTLVLDIKAPGELPQKVTLDQPTMVVGALLSNQVVLKATGVDPIHALLEQEEDGKWLITDLGSTTGIKLNGKKIEVETHIKQGDRIEIGKVILTLDKISEPALSDIVAEKAPNSPPAIPANHVDDGARAATQAAASDSRRQRVLFSPREARPSGKILEVVAYWGNTVLEVEHFSPKLKGFDRVTIGDPTKAHFIAAGKDNISRHVLSQVREDGYKINLKSGMTARLRKSGRVEKVSQGKVSLNRRDIAHIKYGPVSYFMLFVQPPSLNLPRSGPRDPLLSSMMSVAMVIYFLSMGIIFNTIPPEDEKKDDDDIWSIVHIPEKEKPKPKPEVVKKPKVNLAEVKKKPPPIKKPPLPKKKQFTPAPPVEKEKPKQVKPVEKPVPKKANLATLQNKPKPAKVKPPSPKPQPKKSAGATASTGAKNPDFKLAGAKTKGPKGKSGGAKGSGLSQRGGARKGKSKASVKGVEGVKNNKASGPNLSKLGLGVGKILSKTGPSAKYTNFKSSAGGAGGGSGSANKTYGLGGVGNAKSVGLAGSGRAVNNFGSGSGGFLSGEGGRGGTGNAGISGAFSAGGRRRANVQVSRDPITSGGGLTSQEIKAVISANLNQIRHCYEQFLQSSPKASGRVSVAFSIKTNGRVGTSRIVSASVGDSRMKNCIKSKIVRWRFPKPRGGAKVDVTYPFVFVPL